mmetsp:Transcript_24991/g.39257  ORF Transcript_24991/g.39257 Transcript_24991/m.39257 type:complete len:108 (-) Transcript_24991:1010-1333(-)
MMDDDRAAGYDRATLLRRENEVPLRALSLACLLFSLGIILLSIFAAIMTGSIDTQYWWPGQGWKSPALSFFVLGLLSFLPGGYTLYIAYNAYRGTPGFSFSQIPAVR